MVEVFSNTVKLPLRVDTSEVTKQKGCFVEGGLFSVEQLHNTKVIKWERGMLWSLARDSLPLEVVSPDNYFTIHLLTMNTVGLTCNEIVRFYSLPTVLPSGEVCRRGEGEVTHGVLPHTLSSFRKK